MRIRFTIYSCLLLAGCNLFSPTSSSVDMSPDLRDSDSLADLQFSDVPDQWEDLGQPPDAIAADMATSRVWQSVAAGDEHACALTVSGVAYCWGFGGDGQLGNGDTATQVVPVRVEGPPFIEVVGGGEHTCGLDANRALWCWGYGGNFGTPGVHAQPIFVAGGPFSKLVVGTDTVCVIDEQDLAKCIGENDWGQIGLPSGEDVEVLTDIGGAPFPAIDIAAGNEFTCVLGTNNEVTCFGRDLAYPEDDEDADAFLTQPISTPTPLVSIDGGRAHACGQSADGTLFCWGEASLVETLTIGGGPTSAGEVPTVVDFVHYDAGDDVVCGLADDGLSYCLGSNYRAIQGKGSDNRDPSAAEPLERTAAASPFADLSLGERHGCGLTLDDRLLCWGRGFDGRLGNGELGWRDEPYPVDSSVVFSKAVLGEYHSCGLDDAGTLHCWGRGGYGALGTGSYDHAQLPTPVPALTLVAADAWESHTCGVLADGTAYCWGTDNSGALGNGSGGEVNLPALVQAAEPLSSISISDDSACAIGSTQSFCWGNDSEVGEDVGGNRQTPNALPAADHPAFVQLSAGTEHTCGIDAMGAAYCFGLNNLGQLGDGSNTTSRYQSVPVTGGLTFRLVRAGNNFTCGITTSDELYCWGIGARVPDGTNTNRTAPTVESEGLMWADVDLSTTSACAVTTSGDVYCWGAGGLGRLGTGTLATRNSPTPVDLPEPAVHVAAGGAHGCAVGESGQMYCWGSQEFGRLGDGLDTIANRPVPVTIDHLDLGQ